MTLLSRMIQLRGLTVAIANGAEPVVEHVIDIDDCTEVYESDNVIPLFPEIRTRCEARAGFDCIYDATLTGIEYRRCVYCKKLTG